MSRVHHQTPPKKTLWITLVLGGLVMVFGLFIYYISLFIRNDHEKEIRENNFKFEVRDIHPADDKSIQIIVAEDAVEVGNPDEWKNAGPVYVSIIEHKGLARINTISMYDPENADFIEASVKSITDKPPFILKIAYPFEKIFSYELESGKFREAYWETISKPNQHIVAVINISAGKTRVVDIMVNNKSIHDTP